MKPNAIVTEQASTKPDWLWLKLATGAAAFTLAIYIAGDRPKADAANNASQSGLAAEITPLNPVKSNRSLLDDITPISNAEAAISEFSVLPVTRTTTPPALPATLSATDTVSNPEFTLAAPTQTEAAALVRLESREITVKNGDSLSILFDRNQLQAADWMALAALKGDAKRLRRLRPGDKLTLRLDDHSRVAALDMRIDDLRTLEIRRGSDGRFDQTVITDNIEIRQASASGTIENSLFLSAKKAGLSDNVTMELTDIYAWDVDFALDIRSGDRFEVVYEEIYRDGKKIKDGNILAAEFTNQGKALRAVRYSDENNRAAYYSPDGKPMKKAFLRSPVDFTRISSRFSLGRKHPILNRIRAHKGVDYAAPRGTPIKAAGSGKIIFAGRKGGYGRVLIIQHAGKYKTLYAHLNGYGRGMQRGKNVSQGDTIAYVGMSGLATGPHLHYEFLVGEQHVDPLSVKLPSAPTIASKDLARFKSQTKELLAKLDNLESEPANSTEVATAAQ